MLAAQAGHAAKAPATEPGINTHNAGWVRQSPTPVHPAPCYQFGRLQESTAVGVCSCEGFLDLRKLASTLRVAKSTSHSIVPPMLKVR